MRGGCSLKSFGPHTAAWWDCNARGCWKISRYARSVAEHSSLQFWWGVVVIEPGWLDQFCLRIKRSCCTLLGGRAVHLLNVRGLEWIKASSNLLGLCRDCSMEGKEWAIQRVVGVETPQNQKDWFPQCQDVKDFTFFRFSKFEKSVIFAFTSKGLELRATKNPHLLDGKSW